MSAEPTYSELRAWRAVVIEGSFSAAATKLGCRTSSLLTQVRRLGEKLKKELYTTQKMRVQPTDFGKELARRLNAAIPRVEEVLGWCRTQEAWVDTLRVAATLGVWDQRILPALASLRRQGETFHLEMVGRGTRSALKGLRDYRCHMAFVSEYDCGAVELPDAFRSAALRVPLAIELIAAKDCPLLEDPEFKGQLEGESDAAKRHVLNRITSQPLILPFSGSAFREYVMHVLKQHGVSLSDSVQSFDVSYTILAAVHHGFGVTIQQAAPRSTVFEKKLVRVSLKKIFGDWQIRAMWDPSFLPRAGERLLERLCDLDPASAES